MRQRRKTSWRQRLTSAGGTAILFWCCACTSNENPLEAITKEFTPTTPGQAARNAFSYDADKRRQSVLLLSDSKFGGEEPYLKTYRLLLDDPDATVRAACIKALGAHGTVADARDIARHADDAAAFVRWEVAIALQKIHNPDVVPALIKLMTKEDDADVRMTAADALGQYAQMNVFNALVGALDDTDFGVVQAAQHSLLMITGYDMGIDPSLWLVFQQKNAEKVFEKQQRYTYQPYHKPPRWYEEAEFWRSDTPPASRTPTGMDGVAPPSGPPKS